MTPDPDEADFAFDEMPGTSLHALLDTYREHSPVAPTRFFGAKAFVISDHETLDAAFRDDSAFPGHRMYQASFEPAIGKSFISDPDPAEHLRVRKLATPAFRSRAISRFAAHGLEDLAGEICDELASRDEFDLVADFTARFPYLVITRLLGLPRDRESEFHAWALALLTFREDPARALEARNAVSEFLAPVVAERRRQPQDDIISELVHSELDGRRLDDEEIFSHIRLLFPTGGETTHGSLGNLLYALLTHEGEWARVRDGETRVEAAVLEGLRWETPIAVLPRMSRSEEIEFAGVRIPADSWVLFAVAGANRDPALVCDPHVFDPRRLPAQSLVFGRGAKSCPGMHLAKRNMEVAVRVLAERFPHLELIDPETSVPRRTVLRCPDSLRVRQLD